MKKKNLTRVELLVKAADEVKHEALKNAITKHAEEEQKKEEAKLLGQFRYISDILDQEVSRLKTIRAQEKKAVKRVQLVDKAFTKFKEDGDYDAFCKSIKL